MQLTIVLRKEVPDEATAQQLFEIVVEKLESQPDIDITGTVNSQLITPEPE